MRPETGPGHEPGQWPEREPDQVPARTPSRLKPYHGLAVFALVILMSLFVAAPIQRALGILGLVVTELILLLFAIVPALLSKVDLRTMFPVKVPKLRQVFGVLVLWGGGYLAVLIITLFLAYFFPDELYEVSGGLQRVFTSVPLGVALFAVAVMPALCEEALHRGFILATFRSVRSRWLVVLVMGIIFGIFHLDAYRFIPTAFLGMIITYIMVVTGNLVLPILFHFINNAFSTLVAFANRSQATPTGIEPGMILLAISTYLIIGSVVPFLLLGGSRLIQPMESSDGPAVSEAGQKARRRSVLAAAICSTMMFLTGVALAVIRLMGAQIF